MENDHQLYLRFLQGDSASYDELMIRYGDSLTVYLNGYLHDWQDAEEQMIETFARIMVKKPAIGEGCFKAYLYKTARNLAARFHAKRSRFWTLSLDDVETELADRELLEEKLQDEERKRILHLCLERMDPELKEVLWLVYFEECSYAEAASILNIKVKRVDHLLSRGKKRLREELEKEGITRAYE